MLTTLISKLRTMKSLGWIDLGREISRRIGFRVLWDHFSYYYFERRVSYFEGLAISTEAENVFHSGFDLGGVVGNDFFCHLPEIHLFAYWHQGIDLAPEVVKMCRSQIRFVARMQGLRLIELDSKNLKNFISIPECIEKKFQSGTMSFAHYSDYVRTKLVWMYGGMWIDSTLFFSDVIPSDILDSDFFTFRFRARTTQHSSNQLIFASVSGNAILEKMLVLLEYYWEGTHRPETYFFYHYLFSICVSQTALEGVNLGPTRYSEDNHFCYQDFLFGYGVNQTALDFSKSFVHKLTYKVDSSERQALLLRFLGDYMWENSVTH